MRSLLTLFLIVAAARGSDSKPVPPPGIEVSLADRAELQAGLVRLGQSIAQLYDNPPDAQIFYNALRYTLEFSNL